MKKIIVRSCTSLFVFFFLQQGHAQNSTDLAGTHTVAVSTISGEVVDVKLPNDIRPGDHITASVTTTGTATLEGAVIEVQNKKSDLGKKLFSFIVPAGGISTLSLTIFNKAGENICKKDLEINSHFPENNAFTSLVTTPPTAPLINKVFTAPGICIVGSAIPIMGGFDGDASNTKASINKIPCEVIAETPRSVVIAVPANVSIGAGMLRLSENGTSKVFPIQVATINLSAEKLTLKKGESTTIKLSVAGLEGAVLDGRGYTVSLTNMSPQSIAFSKMEGNSMTKELNSSVVSNGTYNFSTEIRGLTTGKYTITSTLTSDWDNYRQKCAMEYQDALDAGLPADYANQYLDFVLAAYHPGTGAGGCVLGPRKSGGVLTCNPGNCTDICIVFSLPKIGPGDPKEEGPSATPAPGRIYFCSCSKWQWF